MLTSGESESLSPHDSGCRYTSFNASPGSSHTLVVELVPRGSRVLEFGPANGYMSEILRDRLGCTVTGIELVPEAAEEARRFCERVIVGDAETLDFAAELAGEEFDVVLFADVLEHLKDPAAVLERVRPLVADEGVVIASIPNIAHGSVRLALLRGEFRYRPTGLLDDTHLRFFTRASIEDLFESCGYIVTRWRRALLDIDRSEIPVLADGLSDGLRERLQADPDATTYQFVTSAVPAEEAAVLRSLREAAGRSLEDFDALRAEHAIALSQVAELEAVRHELDKIRAEADRLALLVQQHDTALAAGAREHEAELAAGAQQHRVELETARAQLAEARAAAELLAIRIEEQDASATDGEAVLVQRDAARTRELELRSLLLQAHADLARRDEQLVPARPSRNWRRTVALRFPRTAAVYHRTTGRHPS